MQAILSLFSINMYIDPVQDFYAWAGLIALVAFSGTILWKTKDLNRPLGRNDWLLLGSFLALTIITNLFLGLRLPAGKALPPPYRAETILQPVIMFFSAVPLFLSAGMLGPVAAFALGLVAGLIRALFFTHSFFTLIEVAFLSLMLGISLRQVYRTRVFQFLRHPLFLLIPIAALSSMLYLLITPLTIPGALVQRFDYALSTLPGFTLARFIELAIAALIGEGLRIALPNSWVKEEHLLPSPAEKSLQTRFLLYMSPLALVMILSLMAAAWYQAGRTAREMVKNNLENTAQVAADQIPLLITSGHQLINQMAEDSRLVSNYPHVVQKALAEDIKTLPYFSHLIIIDEKGSVVAHYPASLPLQPAITGSEKIGIQLAFNGDPSTHVSTIEPGANGTTAQVVFVKLLDIPGFEKRVLIGRSNLEENPISKSIISSFKTLEGDDGESLLLDEYNRIIISPETSQLMAVYRGPISEEGSFSDTIAPDGTRQYIYFQPIEGHSWKIALIVPASRSQLIALEIAGPLLLVIVLLVGISILITRLALGRVTSSLQNLAEQAGKIALGNLDQPLVVDSQDEVGVLRQSFEKMRLSLKTRLDELNRLLSVSQGVASSLEISEAIQPILEAALVTGANLSRIVLMPDVVPDIEGSGSEAIRYSYGPAMGSYQELDAQILNQTRQLNRLVLSNINRPRLINFDAGKPHPASILAVPLQHENKYFGALWTGYEQPHIFSEEEVRFMMTLASHASLATANARLFLNAEIGRQRLAAILASSPDPILVIDQLDHLLLSNPAAWQVLGMNIENSTGLPINKAIQQGDLIELLQSPSTDRQSKEITLPDQRVFLASATAVLAEGQRMGRVCVLRDITHFKQLDSLKTDFVATVSHDLRSPLTLMRGYATMLDGLGHLNEQQTEYVKKIVSAVQDMTHLVNNLLDLGRIDAGVGLQLELVAVSDILDKVVEQLKMQAAQKRIQLIVELPALSLPLIEADRALLQQALQNLVENSIKFTRIDGKVQLRADLQKSDMLFEVEDNGAGISPMDLPRLFERFYRGAQQTGKDQRGTGLGLAIVKSIAEKHYGRVWAESQLGKGSIFYISIPLRQSNIVHETD